ncbi:hypothetical protein L7F22_050403 [Adiantum nelumboides]|nr:hypothetical protein [Adiantum nelumboides]
MIPAKVNLLDGADEVNPGGDRGRVGCVEDRLTFIAIVTGCCSQGRPYLERGHVLHYLILIFNLHDDAVVSNSLITMYGRNESIADARGTFNIMFSRDVVSWNAMITAYVSNALWEEAVDLFRQMDFVPSNLTFLAILSAAANPSALEFGRHVHNLVRASKYKFDVSVNNALINMYGRCANLKGAEDTFAEMEERNGISWTTMLAVCVEHGDDIQACQLYEQMLQECVLPNSVTFVIYLNLCIKKEALAPGKRIHVCMAVSQRKGHVVVETALVNMYGKCGCVERAHQIFDDMPQRNVVSWGTIISVNTQHKLCKEAIQLLQQMQQEGELPDKVIYLSTLDAFSNQTFLKGGQQVEACLSSSKTRLDGSLGTALVRLYGECNRLRDAENVFNNMTETDVFSWNALTTGYLYIEESELIFFCFNRMQQEAISLDDVTFVNLFSACGAGMKLQAVMAAFSQNGCTNESLGYFKRMETEGIRAENSTFSVVDHYNCLIDLLARAGRLDEAEILLKKMPCKSNFVSLMTLLVACRLQSDVDRGEHIAVRACLTDPGNAAPFLVLSNLYAAGESCELVGRRDLPSIDGIMDSQ